MWGWLRALGLDGDADKASREELRSGLGSELWLSSSNTNLLIVMRLFLGCRSEPPSPSAGAELSFSSFLGLLFLWVGDDGDARLGSTRSFWSSFAKAASESCAVDRALKAAFTVLSPMVVGGFRGCRGGSLSGFSTGSVCFSSFIVLEAADSDLKAFLAI